MATPRLLLFGTPGAGKSSLLGALAQAAATQAPLLKGQLVDASGQLDRLKKSTYEAEPDSTDALMTYDVRLESTENGKAATTATLVDCGGASAHEMLKSKEPFASSHPMKKPILEADAVILAVDASLTGKQLAEEFHQFTRWLLDLRRLRGKRTDIADLPVYLVLTKCDQLARKDEPFSRWMQRIEDAKRKVEERFRAHLHKETKGFGTLDFEVWAAAIKRPRVADRPASAEEPFGVAELFHDCLHSAVDFQERRRKSQSRLQNIAVGLTGLVLVLALAVALLAEFQPGERSASLDEKVQAVLPRPEAPPAERLAGSLKKLEEKQATLAELKDDPSFARLASETQEALATYRVELAQYVDLYRTMTALKLPRLAKNEKEIVQQEKDLQAFTYPKEWEETTIGKRVTKYRKEYETFRKTAAADEDWLRGQTSTNYDLYDRSDALYKKVRDKKKYDEQEVKAWTALRPEYEKQILKRPPMPRQDFIPGVTGVKFEELSIFANVKDARSEWTKSKANLSERADFIDERLRK